MKLKEKIIFENFDGDTFKIKIVEAENEHKASFTHYLGNHKNGISKFYKKDAISYVKNILKYKYPEKNITAKIAEKALQYYLIDFKDSIPFPKKKNHKFKFIDLFAGIGGFRIALQNLGGKCVFTSEWDKYSKKTYEANFGEVPFGDITKSETKRYIPDDFDVLCAGFPCQSFSIAGKRGGFEDTRGTLFFDIAKIIKNKRPKAFFLENVKGLRNHDKGKTLSTILTTLREDLGYYVPEPQIINAKDYGVPQNRERIFIVGFRKDLGINKFEYPIGKNENVSLENIL
ncbi:MAG: DNA (cytosine-5-)-methyltransferase, partial [Melioribacteraceae bacterium]